MVLSGGVLKQVIRSMNLLISGGNSHVVLDEAVSLDLPGRSDGVELGSAVQPRAVSSPAHPKERRAEGDGCFAPHNHRRPAQNIWLLDPNGRMWCSQHQPLGLLPPSWAREPNGFRDPPAL